MATAKNEVTGDLIATKLTTDDYRVNYDMVFRKKEIQNETTVSDSTEASISVDSVCSDPS